MLGIYVVVVTLPSLFLSFTCRIERIALQEMWKYYQASGGYSIVIKCILYLNVCVYSTAKIN